MPSFHLATFSTDVTPPEGHPLCGGWIEPARAVDDPLRALGVVLLGQGKPIVLCAFDWVALRNDAHLAVRQTLADAAHTTLDHVSVHAVHPHNAPFADTVAQKLLDEVKGPPCLDLKFFDKVVKDVGKACAKSLEKTKKFTHIGIGSATVKEVASNRRVLGPDGKVKSHAHSATKTPSRERPEGLIDPILRNLIVLGWRHAPAALHYYATHPMSYYGDGRVSADFCGLARQKLQEQDAKVFQVYFTGCAGNVTAGKYNDGAHENRPILRDRMFEGMRASLASTKKTLVEGWDWRIEQVKLPPRKEASFGEEESRKTLEDEKATKAKRGNAAYQLAWLEASGRADRGSAVLDFGVVFVLHQAGEAFIEYQLPPKRCVPSKRCRGELRRRRPGYIPRHPGISKAATSRRWRSRGRRARRFC